MPNPSLRAIHVHPVKSVAGCAAGEAAVEPWGLAGDRRWMVVDADGRQLTQRQDARLALAAAEPLPGGGVRLTAPGMEALRVEVPRGQDGQEGRGEGAGADGAAAVQIWGTPVEAVPAGAAAAEWFSEHLGSEARLVHMADPARDRPLAPGVGGPGRTVSFADEFPLLVTTSASLDALNSLIAQGDHADEGPLPMNRFRPNLVIGGTAPWAEDEWARIRIGELFFRVAKPCGRCVVTTTDQRTGERGKEPLRTLARHRRFGDQLVFGRNLIPEGPGKVSVGDSVEIVG